MTNHDWAAATANTTRQDGEREGGGAGRWVGRQAGRQTDTFQVRLGYFGRDRGERQRDRGERQRDRGERQRDRGERQRDIGERQRYREIMKHRNKETKLTIKIPSKAIDINNYECLT